MKKTNWIAWLLVLILAVTNISANNRNQELANNAKYWKDAAERYEYQAGLYEDLYNGKYEHTEISDAAKAYLTEKSSTYTYDSSSGGYTRSATVYSSSYTYVYVSRTGTKYHDNPNCSNMSNPDYVPLSEAVADGRTACSKCY